MKNIINKIDKALNSIFFNILTLILLLVLIPTIISLGYSNSKLEEQIFERDAHIRKLQYTDSISRTLLDYVETDSSRVLITRWKNGHNMTYKELAEERDSIINKYYNLCNECNRLELKIENYEQILDECKKIFPFNYKIHYYKDSIVTEVIYTTSHMVTD
jgi:hypothetical protein